MKSSRKWTDAGNTREPAERNFTVVLEGTETVTAVSTNGRGTAFTVDVEKCTKDEVELCQPRAVITAESADGKTRYFVDGETPDEEIGRALAELIYVARPDEPTLDDLFGTDKPKKVGDSWAASADQLAKSTHLTFPVTANDFKGTATLTDVSTVDGKQMITVSTDTKCEFDSREGQSGTVKNLKMHRDWTAKFDNAADSAGGSSKGTTRIAFTMVDATGTCDWSTERTRESSWTAVKK